MTKSNNARCRNSASERISNAQVIWNTARRIDEVAAQMSGKYVLSVESDRVGRVISPRDRRLVPYRLSSCITSTSVPPPIGRVVDDSAGGSIIGTPTASGANFFVTPTWS